MSSSKSKCAHRRKEIPMKGLIALGCAILLHSLYMVALGASNSPEFDTVGCDAYNDHVDSRKAAIITNSVDTSGTLVNFHSYWSINGEQNYGEYFYTNMGLLFPGPCCTNAECGDIQGLLDAWHDDGLFEWRIILQKMPTTDIELEIVNCVLKHNTFDIWTGAAQSGWYPESPSEVVFKPEHNPRITVKAMPGPLASDGFKNAGSFIMDARTMPGLGSIPLEDQVVSSMGFWGTHVLMALPQAGKLNTSGQLMHTLRQGDQIKITMAPNIMLVDLFYGPHSAILNYVGAVGSEYTSDFVCDEIANSITITAPNGGERLTAGSVQRVTWNSSGIIPTVDIEYSIDNGVDWITIRKAAKNIGYFQWKIPDTPSSECLLRISRNWYKDYTDVSDSVFSITFIPSAESVLQFFDTSVVNGTLFGDGPGRSAEKRLDAFRRDLTDVIEFVNGGDIEEACEKLMGCHKKCDGSNSPPDFVAGPATGELATMITTVIQSLGCE